MARLTSKAMFTAALLALAVTGASLGGCTPRAPEVAPTPAPPPPEPAPASPDLMGGPPQPEQAPAPTPAPAPDAAMAPIANPEDMTPEERARVYGHRYDYLDRPAAAPMRHGHHPPSASGEAATPPAPHHHHGRVDHERWGERRGDHHRGHESAAAGQARAPAASAAPPASGTGAASSQPPAAPAVTTVTPPPTSGAAPLEGSGLDWLSLPGTPYVDLPGLGRVASKYLVASSLLVIAMALLAAAAFRHRHVLSPRRQAPHTVGSGPRFADEMPRKPPET